MDKKGEESDSSPFFMNIRQLDFTLFYLINESTLLVVDRRAVVRIVSLLGEGFGGLVKHSTLDAQHHGGVLDGKWSFLKK